MALVEGGGGGGKPAIPLDFEPFSFEEEKKKKKKVKPTPIEALRPQAVGAEAKPAPVERATLGVTTTFANRIRKISAAMKSVYPDIEKVTTIFNPHLIVPIVASKLSDPMVEYVGKWLVKKHNEMIGFAGELGKETALAIKNPVKFAIEKAKMHWEGATGIAKAIIDGDTAYVNKLKKEKGYKEIGDIPLIERENAKAKFLNKLLGIAPERSLLGGEEKMSLGEIVPILGNIVDFLDLRYYDERSAKLAEIIAPYWSTKEVGLDLEKVKKEPLPKQKEILEAYDENNDINTRIALISYAVLCSFGLDKAVKAIHSSERMAELAKEYAKASPIKRLLLKVEDVVASGGDNVAIEKLAKEDNEIAELFDFILKNTPKKDKRGRFLAESLLEKVETLSSELGVSPEQAKILARVDNPRDIANALYGISITNLTRKVNRIARSYLPGERALEKYITAPLFEKMKSTFQRIVPPQIRGALYAYGGLPEELQPVFANAEARKQFGFDYALEAAANLKKFESEGYERARKIFKGEIENLTEREEQLLKPIIEEFRKLADEALSWGLMTEEQVSKHYGRYLPILRDLTQRPSEEKIEAAKNFLLEQLAKKKKVLIDDLTEEDVAKVEDDLERIISGRLEGISAYVSKYFYKSQAAAGFLPRKNMPKPIADLFVEVEDLAKVVGRRLFEERRAIETAKLFNFLSYNPEWVSKVEKTGFEKIAEDEKKLGVLAGKYVNKDILPYIRETAEVESLARSIWDDFLTAFKVNKVALQTSTMSRNFLMSNPILADTIGGVPIFGYPKEVSNAITSLIKKDEIFEEAKKLGVFSGTYSEAEILKLSNELKKGGIFPAWLRNAYSKASKGYQALEDISRFAIYRRLRDEGLRPLEAKWIAQASLFNYNEVPKFVKLLRRSPIGMPFITFQYKAMPALVESLIKRPLSVLKWVFLPSAIEKIAMEKYGVDEDYIRERKKALPEYMKDGIWVWFGKEDDGKDRWLDLSYILPWGDWTEAGSKILGIPRLLMPSTPLINFLYAVRTNKDPETQQEIADPYAPQSEQLLSYLDYFWKMIVPNWAPGGYAFNRMKAAILKEKDYRGNIQDAYSASLYLAGLKITNIDYETVRKRNQYKLKEKLDKILGEIDFYLNDKSLTDEQREEKLDKYFKRWRELAFHSEDIDIEWPDLLADGLRRAIRTGNDELIEEIFKKNETLKDKLSFSEITRIVSLEEIKKEIEVREEAYGRDLTDAEKAEILRERERMPFYERPLLRKYVEMLPQGRELIELRSSYDAAYKKLRNLYEDALEKARKMREEKARRKGRSNVRLTKEERAKCGMTRDVYIYNLRKFENNYRQQALRILATIVGFSKNDEAAKGWLEFSNIYSKRAKYYVKTKESPKSAKNKKKEDAFESFISDLSLKYPAWWEEYKMYPGSDKSLKSVLFFPEIRYGEEEEEE